MTVVLGIDGLEYGYVKRFNCKNLMQESYGKTDISEFSEPRTMVLWSSFLTGKNKEKEVIKDLWNFKLNPQETFLKNFKNFKAINIPAFNGDVEFNKLARDNLKRFFNKEITVDEYDKPVFEQHKKIKNNFLKALESKNELIFVYFDIIDLIGHLSFGMDSKMRILYKEMDDLAKLVKEKTDGKILIISDHGMKAVGMFGDHSDHGFWSVNFKINLKNPKITDFAKIIIA